MRSHSLMSKKILVLGEMRIYQHQISLRFKISHRCIRQIFSKFHTVAKKPGAARPPKETDCEKRLIKQHQF